MSGFEPPSLKKAAPPSEDRDRPPPLFQTCFAREPDGRAGSGIAIAGPGLYLYAVLHAQDFKGPADSGTDPAWESLKLIESGALGALAAQVSERAAHKGGGFLRSHHRVLRPLLEKADFLPFRLGTIARSREAIEVFLRGRRRELMCELVRVAGKVEMSLIVRWNTEDVFDCLARRHLSLRRMRNALATRGLDKSSREDKLALARHFESLLEEERQGHKNAIMDGIYPCCDEARILPPVNEHVLLAAACLVARDRSAEFREIALRVTEKLRPDCVFHCGGPRPPYHFVSLSL